MRDPSTRPHRGEPMRCPSCGTRLVELERSDVLIDACPECRGVWLDRGELDRILDRERRAAAGVRDDDEDFFVEMEGRRGGGRREAPRDDDRDRDRDRDRPRRRRKGLLEDLFDLDF
ncbi:zf-TFIIB domain-containing protein [Miltoncostaea marina]|uniref:TFIIB-type zinc ribbon-containing protein n=1 Tax=Miltoncostaea marina TaxID=2843215 RepID=UPI001C3C52F3|nr:zf-TFIIB domain-containing protein [Miltoncostaea marina]